MGQKWIAKSPAIITRRKLLTGAAAIAAYAALGTDPAAAAPFIIGTAIAGAGAGGTTGAINTTGANYICITQSYFFPSGFAAPTDNKGNTYTLVQHETSSPNSFRVDVYECFNPTVGAGHTFSNGSIHNFTLCVAAYSGATSGGAALGSVVNTGTATSIQTGSLTPSQTNTLLITGIVSQDSVSATYAINTGFSIRETVAPNSGVSEGGALADFWQGAPVATNPTWSGLSGSSEMSVVMIQVPMSSGPPSGSVCNRSLLGVGC